MIEFAILLHVKWILDSNVSRLVVSRNAKNYLQSPIEKSVNGDEGCLEGFLEQEKGNKFADDTIKKKNIRFIHKAKRMDYISLIISIVMFCLFNLIYWMYLLLF